MFIETKEPIGKMTKVEIDRAIKEHVACRTIGGRKVFIFPSDRETDSYYACVHNEVENCTCMYFTTETGKAVIGSSGIYGVNFEEDENDIAGFWSNKYWKAHSTEAGTKFEQCNI